MRSILTVMVVAGAAGVAGAQSVYEEMNPRPADAPADAIVADASVATGDSIDAVCKTFSYCVKVKNKAARKAKAVAPYKAFAVVEREDDREEHTVDLAVQMTTGAWVLVPLDHWYSEGARDGSVTVSTVKVKDVVPGGDPEILVTGTVTEEAFDDFDHGASTTTTMLWVCGIGASGVPSCADVVIGVKAEPYEERSYKFKLSYKFDATGRVVRKVKGKWPKRAQVDKAEYVNTLPLYFR